jgi:predicted O-methyltransferase YrrM
MRRNPAKNRGLDVESIGKIASKVEGCLTEREGKLLYGLAKNCSGKGVIIEIGSYKGRSTIWLAAGSKAGNHVRIYAIDPHTGSSEHRQMYGKVWTLEEFKRNIKDAKVDDVVVPIVKTSEEAEKDLRGSSVELLWIDGAHEYELVKLDFELWFPYLIEGGWIALHDSTVWPGPKLIAEKMLKSKHFKNMGFVDSIILGQKVKHNKMRDRLKNRLLLLTKRFTELEKQNVSLLRITCDFIVNKSCLFNPIKRIANKIARLIDEHERGLPLYDFYRWSLLGRMNISRWRWLKWLKA